MAYFIITYDLVKNKDYLKLTTELTRIGSEKIALSAWLVQQNMTAKSLKDHLANFIDEDDKLIVIEFSKRPAFTRGFTAGANWIIKHFSKVLS